MRRIVAGLILVGLLGMTAAAAPAQDAATDRAILRAAVHHVRSTLPRGQWRLDPGVLSARDGQALAATLGVPVSREADVHVCGATPRECRLVDASALIVVQRAPVVTGDSANVILRYYATTTEARRPLYVSASRVTLAHTQKGWVVVHSTLLRRS
jgi:hypothetical protein